MEVRRELDADYTAQQQCRSTLRIDGVVRQSVREVGLPLSSGPLGAPVLLAHTLRWVLSASPSDRANYFKALLDVTDLELVRSELEKLRDEYNQKPDHPSIAKLRECEESFGEGQALGRRLRAAADLGPVEATLCDFVRAVLDKASVVVTPGASLSELTDALDSELGSRRAKVFPLDQLRARQLQGLQAPPDAAADVMERYGNAVAALDAQTARMIPVFTSVLGVPEVDKAVQALDCPVCATPQALTPTRIAELRCHLADNASLRDAAASLMDWVGGHVAVAGATADIAGRAAVPSERWTADEQASRRADAIALGVEPSVFDEVMAKLVELIERRGTLAQAAEVWAKAATVVRDVIERVQPLTDEHLVPLKTAADTATQEDGRLRVAIGTYRQCFDRLSNSVSEVLDQRVDTSGWAPLLSLARAPAEIAYALQKSHRRVRVRQRLTRAVADVESAITGVLDNRFSSMSDEVRRWWTTLRPGELVSFEDVRRRAGGKRYIDVKARLSPGPGRPGVLRDAISVLSTSQLNALGLSAFLARCHIEGAPLIILDDPIPASDPEHRYTFADQTVSALLDNNIQLLITTHDPELAELLQVSHAHRGVDEYTVILDDPATGSALLRSRDEFEHLLRKAEQQMYSPLPDNRKAAGQFLREAAERLSKQVLVAHRNATGQSTKFSDFDGKALRDLIPLVTQYAVGTDEPGKWLVLKNVLNPANHSAPPPQSIALRNAHGNLRKFKKDHQASLPGLRIT